MAKRKSKKKTRALKSLLYIFLALVIAAVSYFTKPWEYLSQNDSERTPPLISAEVDPSSLAVYFIDVGQADSILIRMPSGENVLIDAGCENGAEQSKIDSYIDGIKALGVSKIDYLFLTHPHYDHIGAADEVIYNFEIGEIVLPECDPAMWSKVLTAMEAKNLTYTPAEVGTIYNIGNASFKILAPVDAESVKTDDKNNYSLVIRMVYGNTAFMFTGDAETESETALLKYFEGEDISCDVLKVGHHGSTTSTSVKFLKAVDPSVAVISCGKDNSYGHPHTKILERIAEYTSAEILRTDELGTVVITSDGEKITHVTS
ncbi:MAG: ComEC/Rec2 family competence protein [Eubacteriales bacterium]